MLAAESQTLQAVQAIDTALMICGGLCALGFVVHLVRRGEWRDPLARVRPGSGGPALVHTPIVLLVYVALGVALAMLTVGRFSAEAVAQEGSHAWHVAQVGDALAKLVAGGVIIWILRQNPTFAAVSDSRLRWVGIVGAGVLGGLVVAPICMVQLQMCSILWQWFNPDAVLPVHPVLLAIRDNAWGWWGGLQLLLTAVVVAPLVEELFFRGLILQTVWHYARQAWLAVIISSVAFGAVHGQPQDILPLCTMGIVLGYLRLRTRSLTACVIAHAVFNARTMILALYFPELVGEG